MSLNTKVIKKTGNGGLIATSNDLLIEAQWPQLKINEQRLVLYMLSLIQRDDKDFKPYRISVRELCNIMDGSRKDLYARFDEATDGLMKKVIRWINPDEKGEKRIDKTTWCSSASVIPGQGCVELRFDPTLKPFLLALKGNFTTWGEARAVIRLKNHYSLRLYQFMKYNQGLASVDNRQSVVVEVSWLRDYLSITDDTYKLFGHFKSKVLVPAQKDIATKTDIEFNFKQIKKGRKVEELEFVWKQNKRYDQKELPGFIEGGKATLEDILILEFGITPEKKAAELVHHYGPDHIQEALQVVREYINKLRKRGQKPENVGGIARKAIEEGWKPQKAAIEIEYEDKKKAAEKARVAGLKREEEQEAIEKELQFRAMSRYEAMPEGQKNNVLSEFHQHLIETGNQVIVDRYNENGISPGVTEALFRVFIHEKLGEERK